MLASSLLQDDLIRSASCSLVGTPHVSPVQQGGGRGYASWFDHNALGTWYRQGENMRYAVPQLLDDVPTLLCLCLRLGHREGFNTTTALLRYPLELSWAIADSFFTTQSAEIMRRGSSISGRNDLSIRRNAASEGPGYILQSDPSSSLYPKRLRGVVVL